MSRDKKWNIEEIHMEADAIVDSLSYVFNGVFTNGTRVVFLMHRAKEGGESEEDKRRKMTRIVHDTESLKRALRQMLVFAHATGDTLRVYMTINSRDLHKGLRELKRRLLDLEYTSEQNKIDFMKRMYGRWDSCLMEYGARSSSYFMFDIDDKSRIDDVQKFCGMNNVQIIYQYPTKNGYHIITEPFNVSLFKEDTQVSIQKDGQMLLWFS